MYCKVPSTQLRNIILALPFGQNNQSHNNEYGEQFRVCHQPNWLVKPTPTSSACGCPPHFVLRRGLPRALGPSFPSSLEVIKHMLAFEFIEASAAT